MVFLTDLDGTVFDIKHRLHHIQKKDQDWRGFFKDCVDDKPIAGMVELLQSLNSAGNTIFALTGRSDEVRMETERSLIQHGIVIDRVYMRKAGDHRKDTILKDEQLTELLKSVPITSIGGMFEDSKEIAALFRDRGIPVFLVA